MGLDAKVARGLRAGTTVLALSGTVGLLAACGGSGEGESAPATSADRTTAAASGGGSCAATVKKRVAEERAPMKMVLPAKSFDMSQNKGRSVWFVTPSQATGYGLGLSKSVTEAAKHVGMSVTIFDGKGQPDRFTQGLTQAVAQKADGIILYGIDPALVPEGLKAAKGAGVPVVTMGSGKPAPPDGSVVEALNFDIDAQGRYMADYAAFAADCQVDGATSFDSTYPTLVKERDGIQATLEELCPDTCEVQDHKMKLGDMATALGPSTQSLIQRNPDLNTIFATFDQAATYQIPAVEQSGADVKIIGTNGLPENFDAIRKGSPQIADVAYPPTEYFGWLGLDQLARAMAGEKVGDENGDPFVMPVQTFDKSNLPATNDFAELYPELADYQAAFDEKWGM